MFIFDRGKSQSFASLAEKHYELLQGKRNAKAGKSAFYKYSINKKIDQLAVPGDQANTFFRDLKANDYLLAKEIITGVPEKLAALVDQIEGHIVNNHYPRILDTDNNLTDFGQAVKYVFDYGSFCRKDTPIWNAYNLADELGINVCAYCNRGYTFVVYSKGKGLVRPEFDHFYSKDRYPYLGLSFYNLIPSCHICNSTLKHTKLFTFQTHLHPYVESLDDIIRFSVQFKVNFDKDDKTKFGVEFFYGQPDSFDLVVKARSGQKFGSRRRAIRNLEVFKIQELYNRHKDLVLEMILNSIIYDESYIDELLANYGNLFRNRSDVVQHITKNMVSDTSMPHRAFSKLARDIHMEFGLAY